MQKLSALLALLALTPLAHATSPAAAPAPTTEIAPIRRETLAEYDARMKWFSEARLGMFIHWGLYSQPAGEWKGKKVSGGAEWIQQYCAIPSTEYAKLIDTWKAEKYDPVAWVRTAKAAGIKYICITTKHHDGFCLWPTKTNSDWNVMRTPAARDLLKPLADACRAEGLRFCIYHSIPDWHHADWPVRPPYNNHASGPVNKERYKKEYLIPQLTELFTGYGDIGMIWLDDGGMFKNSGWTQQDGLEIENLIRKLQPQTIIDDRSGAMPTAPNGAHHAGDYGSPEFVNPSGVQNHYWEACWTIQGPNNWGYNRNTGFRSYEQILRHVISTAALGGNLLLNVGPTAEGEFPPETVDRLGHMAKWMAVNSESIHGTGPSPFRELEFEGRCTQKPGKLYLHVFARPDSGVLELPLLTKVKGARLLADSAKQPLAVTAGAEGIRIALPATLPDAVATVVVVDLDGPVQVGHPASLTTGKPVEVASTWAGRPDLDPKHLTDGNEVTMYAAAQTERRIVATVDLQGEHTLDKVAFSDAPFRRTRGYAIELLAGDKWTTVGEGAETAASGWAQVKLAGAKASKIRVTIKDATATPVIAEIRATGK